MMKKFILALAVCLAMQVFPVSAKAQQTWSELALPGSVNSLYPVSATNRPVQSNSQFSNQVDVYTLWSDNSIRVNGETYSCRYRSGHPICGYFFSGWVNLGGSMLNTPSAVGWYNHREVFATAVDGSVVHNWSDNNSTWSGWNSLGAPEPMCSSPSATSWAPGRIDVFVFGCNDHRLWHTWFSTVNGSTWQGWEITPSTGVISTYPTAISLGVGNLAVVTADSASNVQVAFYTPDFGWYTNQTGLVSCGDPTIAKQADGVAVFAYACGSQQLLGASFNYGIWHTGVTPITVDPQAVAPAARTSSSGDAMVYYRDATKHIVSEGWSVNGWYTTAGTTIGTDIFRSDPTVVLAVPTPASTPSWLFAVKDDASLWYTYLTN